MNERRFELLLTWALLGFALAYGVRMYTYPSDAGRVPSIVAGVMVAALMVQLVLSRRSPREEAAGEHATARSGSQEGQHSVTDTPSTERSEARPAEPEPDNYANLIALTPLRRRRFWTITGFAVIFAAGIPLVGFVVTAGVTVAGILLLAREQPVTVAAGAAVATAAAYGLVVGLIGLPPLHGLLLG